jgi:uncharacterized protein
MAYAPIALVPRATGTDRSVPTEWEALPLQIDELTVIAKVSERCNLACPYCYYFFMGDESFASRPAQMTEEVIEQVVRGLEQFVTQCHPRKINFTFHGGEPMLLKPRRFALLCQLLHDRLGPHVALRLGLQTNGAHMSDEWLQLFARFDVHVGVSVDGPPEYQDRERPRLDGGPSSPDVLNSIRALNAKAAEGSIHAPGSLTVLNKDFDLDRILDYLTTACGFRSINFLLPDAAALDPTFTSATARRYGELICTLFDYAMAHPDIHVREAEEILNKFQVKKLVVDPGFELKTRADCFETSAIVVMHSDATISIDDSLIPTGSWRLSSPNLPLDRYAIRDLFSHPAYSELREGMAHIPPECDGCKWKYLCRGGRLEDRPQSRGKGFRTKSVYCEGLQLVHEHVAAYLQDNGYPEETLSAILQGPDAALRAQAPSEPAGDAGGP